MIPVPRLSAFYGGISQDDNEQDHCKIGDFQLGPSYGEQHREAMTGN